jgi:hypothetical protein
LISTAFTGFRLREWIQGHRGGFRATRGGFRATGGGFRATGVGFRATEGGFSHLTGLAGTDAKIVLLYLARIHRVHHPHAAGTQPSA